MTFFFPKKSLEIIGEFYSFFVSDYAARKEKEEEEERKHGGEGESRNRISFQDWISNFKWRPTQSPRKKKTEKQNSVHFLFQLRARQVLTQTQKTRERRERKKNEKRRQRIHRTLLLSRLSSRSSVSSRRPRPNHFTSLKEITSSNFLISLSLSLCLSEGKKEDNSCSFFRRIR